MVCPKCNSENVSIQVINEVKMVKKHHGILWWLCIGWWWVALKWFFFFWIALIFKIFGVGGRYKTKNIQKNINVCQNCGHNF